MFKQRRIFGHFYNHPDDARLTSRAPLHVGMEGGGRLRGGAAPSGMQGRPRSVVRARLRCYGSGCWASWN